MLAGMTMLIAAAAQAVEGAAETAGGAAHKAGGLPQLNPEYFTPQLFWLAVTFLALLFIMSKIALPRVGEVIEERQERIQRDLDAAGRLKGETDKALADYEKALADARGNASAIAKETRERLAAETDAQRHRVDAEISSKLQSADARISQTKSKALSAVSDIATDTARAVVSKLIGEDVSADDVKKVLRPVAGE